MLENLSVGRVVKYGSDELELIEVRECDLGKIKQYIFYSTKAYDPETGRRQQFEIVENSLDRTSTFIEQTLDINDEGQSILSNDNSYAFFTEFDYKINKVIGRNDDKFSIDDVLTYSVFVNQKNEDDVLLKVQYPNKLVLYFKDREFDIKNLHLKSRFSWSAFFWILLLVVVIGVTVFWFYHLNG